MSYELLSTTLDIKSFIDKLYGTSTIPDLYIDLEGVNLCRHGSISLLTILVDNDPVIKLVDVTELQDGAFSTPGSNGTTLRQILESQVITKVFFDIRNDSDALFAHFQVRMAGVEDLQLLEFASRSQPKQYVNGLAKCIAADAQLGWAEGQKCLKVKNAGRKLFAPECGGSYAVFAQRPLSLEIAEYCCQDVRLMPKLRWTYRAKLCDASWLLIQAATEARIRESQSVSYDGKGRHKAIGPRELAAFVPSYTQRRTRGLLARSEPDR